MFSPWLHLTLEPRLGPLALTRGVHVAAPRVLSLYPSLPLARGNMAAFLKKEARHPMLSLHYQKLSIEDASVYPLPHPGEQCSQMLEETRGSAGWSEQKDDLAVCVIFFSEKPLRGGPSVQVYREPIRPSLMMEKLW